MTNPFELYDPREARRISRLIAGYIQGSLSASAHQELDDWVNASDTNMKLFEDLTDPAKLSADINTLQNINTEAALKRVKERPDFAKEKLQAVRARTKFSFLRAAAAILIVGLTAGLIYYFNSLQNRSGETFLSNAKQPTLQMGEGDIADLSATNQTATLAPGIINNIAEQELRYDAYRGKDTATHLVSVPKGSIYTIVLNDGTRVKLNTGSKLRYPAAFTGSTRQVTLQGEAWFEVAPDASRPFIITAGASRVRVLGTRFNINMKQGGTVITTVSEGKVAFSEYSKTVELTANESGLAYADGRLVEEKVDIKPLLAWKENKFIFENASIREVMHSLEQWYDVSVEYKQEPDDHFNLEISRSEPVQKVLALMEQTGRVKFRLKDNKIVVQR